MTIFDLTVFLSIGVLLFFGAFFSGSETAMFAASFFKAKDEAEKGKTWAKKFIELHKKPEEMLTTLLVGNNLVNIGAATLLTWYISDRLQAGPGLIIASSIALTVLIILFAELLPKSISAKYPNGVARRIVWPLWLLHRVIYWLTITISKVISLVIRSPQTNQYKLSIAEIKRAIRISFSQGDEGLDDKLDTGGEDQKLADVLLSTLDGKEISVENIIVHKEIVTYLYLTDSYDDQIKALTENDFDMLPVKENPSSESVKFFVYQHQMIGKLLKSDKKPIELKDIKVDEQIKYISVPEKISLFRALQILEGHHHEFGNGYMAVVLDEYQDEVGIITRLDLLQKCFNVESSSLEEPSKTDYIAPEPQSDGSCLAAGITLVSDINRIMDWAVDDSIDEQEKAATIGGLVTNKLGDIPTEAVSIEIPGFIIEASPNQDQEHSQIGPIGQVVIRKTTSSE